MIENVQYSNWTKTPQATPENKPVNKVFFSMLFIFNADNLPANLDACEVSKNIMK